MALREFVSDSLTIMRLMAGDRADRYVGEILLPNLSRACRTPSYTVPDLRDAISEPYHCLQAILGHYAFSRRGKDRSELGEMASEALWITCRPEAIGEFLKEPDAGRLWASFVEVCKERGRKPMEQLNRGVIAGIAELAQEIYREDGIGSIAQWVARAVCDTDRIETQFLRIVDIRGVGPKLGSLLSRDFVFLFGLESQLDHADRLYVQPIDKWLRLIAPLIVEEIEPGDVADWVLAGKISKYTRHADLSGIAFNMGTTYFGLREARSPERFDETLMQALTQRAHVL